MSLLHRSLRVSIFLVSAITAGLAQTPGTAFSASVPSGGKHEILLPIAKWGRYSIRCSGEQPVALSISDRRTGIMERDGDAGRRNPRIDLFLDIGEYKLTVLGSKNAAGTSQVTATPFALPEGFKPAYLVPYRENRMSLDDFQQTAFWFEAFADTSVYIEAVGRNLADLALWRDGEWLVKTDNHTFIAKPKDETPLSGISFSARVPKGIYMVAAYGGKGRSWSIKSDEHPLCIQAGIETLADNGLNAMTIPPRGYAQFLLHPGTDRFVLEGPDKKRLIAEMNRLGPGFEPAGWMATDSIHGKLSSPRIFMQSQTMSQGNGYRVVKISGTPGQSFTVQTMGGSQAHLQGVEAKSWWVSTLHTGNPGDQIGASGLVIETGKGAIVAMQADTLSSNREVARRFNLLGDVNAFVWVDENGKYSMVPGGTEYSWRLGRFHFTPPADYKAPEWSTGTKTLELAQGLHRLEMSPKNKGIATLVLKKASVLGGMISAGKAALGASGDDRAWNAPRPAMRFSGLAPGSGENFLVVANAQAPEWTSVYRRALPIDSDDPLGFWLRPGEKLDIPIRLAGRRMVSVVDVRGAFVPFSGNGTRFDKASVWDAGAYTVSLMGGAGEARLMVLKSVKPERQPTAAAPVFPDEKRDAIPKFPAVAPGKTAFLDLDRNGNRPYALEVAEPGLYRIETTGRLSTRLALNDRFMHFTRSASANGVGRNALLIEYLLPGRYQVTVAANGASAGRLGLAAFRNALVEGGALEAAIDNRKFIESFSGAGYDIRIPAAGRYRIESMGQNGNYSIRLEDKDGWPEQPAVSDGPLELRLEKGTYRLLSLPTAQEGRRIARLLPIVEKRAIKGRGPHPLPINTTLASTWVEGGKKDAANAPALFTFVLPAPISAKLTVTDGFKGTLYRTGSDSALLSWSGRKKRNLAMGSYRIAVRPEKKRNHAPYQVSVATRDLIPGLSYSLDKKETLAISLGAASIVEIGSQGMLDVTATLLDGDGKTVIAANDDGFLDWNFSISRSLRPGRYFLRTESAEPGFSSTTVFMRALTDTLMDTLSAGAGSKPVQCNLNRRLGVFPLAPGDGDILAFAAQGKSRIGCSLEKAGAAADEWIIVAQDGGLFPSIAVPRAPGARYRLKVWSESDVDEKISLTHVSARARPTGWKEAESGLSGEPERLGAGYRAWFKIDLGAHAPGHIRASSDQNPLSGIGASQALDSAFTLESSAWFAAGERYSWVELRFEQGERFKVKLSPMLLGDKETLAIPLSGGRPRVFETRLSAGAIGLLSVETDGATPIAGMASRGEGKAARFLVRGVPVNQALWMDQGRAATVSLPGDERRAVAWNALPPVDGTQPTAKLAWTELPLADGGALSPGVSSWNAGKPSARVHHLAKGALFRLRVTLPPQSAVFLKRGDGSNALECSFGDEPIVREFTSDGGDLYLLGLTDKAKFDIAAFALGPEDKAGAMADQTISTGAGWQVRLAGEGMKLLPLAAAVDKPSGLFFRGAARNADWIGGDGMMRADLYNGAPVGPGGILRVDHADGWAKMDLCQGRDKAEVMGCKWGASLAPSGSVELGQSMLVKLHDRSNWFTFTIGDSARHVNFSAPLPLAAILLKDGVPAQYQEAWDAFNWDLPLPPGKYALGIHPLAGASLEGAPLSALFRSIGSLGEKRPYSAFMGPGESRLLRFDVAKQDHFGVGLRMGRETVQARLYDSKGNLLEQGKQQFVALKPGYYHVWLRVPEGAEGTEVTVNLFGQEPPPNEPPEKLVKWIINGAEGERPNVENSQEADPENQPPAWERFLKRPGYERVSENAGEPSEEDGSGGEGGDSPESEGQADGEGNGEGGEQPAQDMDGEQGDSGAGDGE